MGLIKSVSGVRGIVRSERPGEITMNEDVARRMGRAYATYLHRNESSGGGLTLVGGRDGRAGGDSLLTAFAHGARASGIDVIEIAIATTPGVAMTVKALGAVGGVVITASHNPSQWNGIKLMTADGQAPPKAAAEVIFGIFDSGDFHDGPISGGKSRRVIEPHEHHVATVLGIVDSQRIRDRKFSVVLDSVNGAGAVVGRMLLERLGCRVVHMNADSAPDFAHAPEPIEANLDDICSRVPTEAADIGFAQDPDADRVAIIDENGRFIGEELTLALCAERVFATCPGPAATNLSTSRLIDDLAAAAGGPCRVYRSAVGEANVVEVMKAYGCVIGGEGNGGVIDPRVVLVRDSLVGMALVLDLLAAEEQALSRIVGRMPGYAMLKDKIACDAGRIGPALAAVREAFANESVNDIDGLRVDWPGQRKWVHVRGSNTEPIMRIIVEAEDDETAQALMRRVHDLIAATLR